MAPTSINLGPFKSEIIRLYLKENQTVKDICKFLADQDVYLTARTLEQKLKS